MTNNIPPHSRPFAGIGTSAPTPAPFRSDLLVRLRALFNFMIASYSRIMFLRIDPRFPADRKYPIDNAIFTNFLESYLRNVERHWGPSTYLWVREKKTTAPNHHYHIAHFIALPPEKSEYGVTKGKLFDLSGRLWAKNIGLDPNIPNGLVDHCEHDLDRFPLGNGVIIDKGNPEWMQRVEYCYQWGTYLAKCYSKEILPQQIRSTGSSRLPHQG